MRCLRHSLIDKLSLISKSTKRSSGRAKLHSTACVPEPTMVRLKDRYLLANIIYTDVPPGQAKGSVPDLLLYNQPTTNELRPQLLLKAIRSEVASLFGDCGSGAVDRSLQGRRKKDLIYVLFSFNTANHNTQ